MERLHKKQIYPIHLNRQTLISHVMNVFDSLRKNFICSEEKPFGAQQMKQKQTVNVCMLLIRRLIDRGVQLVLMYLRVLSW